MTFEEDQLRQREKLLANMGLRSRRLAPRQNPQTARLGDGSRPLLPYDPYDSGTYDDVVKQIQQAAALAEVVTAQDEIAAQRREIDILKKQMAVLYPPMPRGTSDSSSTAIFESVICEEDGGSNGDESTKASWTYTVTGATVSGTGITPLNPRQIGLTEEPAGPWYGMARVNDAGEIELYLSEPIDGGACPDGEDITGGF